MILGGIGGTQSTYWRELKKTAKKTRKKKTIEFIASTNYIDQILKPCLEPWTSALEEDKRRLIYMKDGASIHSSAKDCLKRPSYRIELIGWKLTSPDLNPTKNI